MKARKSNRKGREQSGQHSAVREGRKTAREEARRAHPSVLDRRLEDLEIAAGVAALLSSTVLPLASLGLFSDGGDGWIHFFAKSVLKTATPEQVAAQLKTESCSTFSKANPILSKASGDKIRGSEVYALGFQMVVLAVGTSATAYAAEMAWRVPCRRL